MPFRLTNAPVLFQAYINQALASLIDVICIVYLDDILIFSEDPKEHLHHVGLILERLQRYSLYAKVVKYVFDVE